MHIEGEIVRLRAVEPEDIDRMYAWENDARIWLVSGTTEPFSRYQMERFVAEQQQADIFRAGQLRLMIEAPRAAAAVAETSAGRNDKHAGTDEGTKIADGISAAETSAARNDEHAGTDEGTETPGGIDAAETSANRNATLCKSGGTGRAASNPEAPEANPACWEAVGAVDLFEVDPVNRRAGVGILIHAAKDRGRGYASDAVQALCRYAAGTLGMHQLWCNVGADNAASLRLFRAAGFTEVGIKRDWQWRPDGYRDEVMMQKILAGNA